MGSLDAYVLTFNCGREVIKPSVFAPYLLSAATDKPGLLVLCLQEIAPIGYAYLGGSFVSPYFNAFRQAVKQAGNSYVNVIARNIGLTAIMVFAQDEIASDISWLQTGMVGVGVSETGNKGAVAVRVGYGTGDQATHMTFVSAHLAPMEDQLERRNQDYKDIVQRLVFVNEKKSPAEDEEDEDAPLLQGRMPHGGDIGLYDPNSHLFVAGDFNYRTSLQAPSEEDVKRFPQPTKDESDPRHFSHFLDHDQLQQQLKAGKTLHGLIEQPINFLPTYKYRYHGEIANDAEHEWKWASHRWPSWCDRILYSPSGIKPHSYTSLPLFGTSDHRPVALSLSVPLGSVSEAFDGRPAPFSIDPEWQSKRNAARQKEIMFGLVAYLGWTWEGNGLLLATTVGALGGWLIIRSMLA